MAMCHAGRRQNSNLRLATRNLACTLHTQPLQPTQHRLTTTKEGIFLFPVLAFFVQAAKRAAGGAVTPVCG